jgi:hypothetical protein
VANGAVSHMRNVGPRWKAVEAVNEDTSSVAIGGVHDATI